MAGRQYDRCECFEGDRYGPHEGLSYRAGRPGWSGLKIGRGAAEKVRLTYILENVSILDVFGPPLYFGALLPKV